MKNFEKYEHQISKLVNEDNILPCAIATVAGIRKEKPCYHQECEECHKKCIEWMYSEYKEHILTDEEKEIVKSMCDTIHMFECKAINVRKRFKYITLTYKTIDNCLDYVFSPDLKKDMFKGMELDKEYTLEELGITCQTQKDS